MNKKRIYSHLHGTCPLLLMLLLITNSVVSYQFFSVSGHGEEYDALQIFTICLTASAEGLKDSDTLYNKVVYSELSDGYSKFLGTSNVHNWSNVRNNATGNQRDDSNNSYSKGILAAYNSKTGDLYVISRSFFAFNTSFLGENTTIVKAELFIYGLGTNESSVCIVSWDDGPDGVDFDDYGYVGDENFGNTNEWFIDTYNRIPFNENGLAYINKTGYTYIACREYEHDFLNIAPQDERLAEYRNGHYFSNEPGTNKDPYLLIEYYSNDSSIDQKDDNGVPALSIYGILIVFSIYLIYIRRKSRKE